jgi:hypothetical protein
MTSPSLAEPSTLSARSPALAGPLPWKLLTAALLTAALAIGLFVSVPDVTWLQIAAERLLHGQRLYAQVLEVNPPLSVLVYAPAVALADALGVRPEAVTATFCVLAIAASLGLSGLILRPMIGADAERGWKLAAAGAFVLSLMPAAAFGQREHLAVIALLPFLALTILRGDGGRPALPAAILAGLGLGLAVALKPHFAAAAGLPLLWAVRRRPLRVLVFPELWTAALVLGTYALAVLALFPDYLKGVVPILREVYLPVRTPLWLLLILPGVPLAFGAALVARLMRLDMRWAAAPFLAGLGGAVAFVVQGKGWPYHAYPMLAFAALGLLGAAATTCRAWSFVERPVLLAAPITAAVWLAANVDSASLARASAAAAPPAPKLIAITGNLGVGMPVVRALHARWLGSGPSLWISDGVLRREEAEPLSPTERQRLDGLMSAERARLSEDIRAGRPDLILIDRKKFDWGAWALKDRGVAASLQGYRRTGEAKGIEIWTLSAR